MAAILLIDDDDDVRAMTVAVLRAAGHMVNDAPDGNSGLLLYEIGQHALVITDIVMPGMDGVELIESLRHAVPRPRVIAMSGDARFGASVYLSVAKGLGVQRALAKPVRPEVLLQAVAEVLAEPAPPTVPRATS